MEMNVMLTPLVAGGGPGQCGRHPRYHPYRQEIRQKSALATRRFDDNSFQQRGMEDGSMKRTHPISRWAGIVLLSLLSGCQTTQAN